MTIDDDLGFTTDFPGGNGVVSYRPAVHEDHSVIELAAEARGSAAPLWFHVRVRGLAGERVDVRLANALQFDGDPRAWAGNTIVYRDGAEPWRRSTLPIVEFDEAGVERVAYPLFFRSNEAEIAWNFPYQRSDLHHTLRSCPEWAAARIGRTATGQVIERYRARSSAPSSTGASRPGVYILSRQVAGDVAASWTLDGLLQAASHSEMGREIAKDVELWVVPFVDFDGVNSGAPGRRRLDGDLELAWSEPAGATEVQAVMLDLHRLRERFAPLLVIDLQATTHSERDTYFRVPAVDNALYEGARRFVDQVRSAAPAELLTDRFVETSPFADRRRSMINWITNTLGTPALSLHVSHQGTPKKNFEIEDYHRLGQALLVAIGALAQRRKLNG